MTEGWVRYIREQLDARERAMRRAVAQVVVEEERQRQALGERVTTLEADIANLRAELRANQERSRGLRAVASDACPP